MANDRFVYWTDENPDKAELRDIIEDYLEGSAESITWDEDRFFVTLIGKPSFPFKRVALDKYIPEFGDKTRWFEVWMGSTCVDIITRQADEYTNVVAAGLQELLKRFYKGAFDV